MIYISIQQAVQIETITHRRRYHYQSGVIHRHRDTQRLARR